MLFDNAEGVVKRVFRGASERIEYSDRQTDRRRFYATHHVLDDTSATAILSLFSKDYYTFSHCVQVSTLGMSFCKFLGSSKPEITDFGLGTLFHDLGKNEISDNILNKHGKLEKSEFEILSNIRYLVISNSKKQTFFPRTNSMLCFIITKQWMGPATLKGLSGM